MAQFANEALKHIKALKLGLKSLKTKREGPQDPPQLGKSPNALNWVFKRGWNVC